MQVMRRGQHTPRMPAAHLSAILPRLSPATGVERMHSSTCQDQPPTADSASRCWASGFAGAAAPAGALKQVYLRQRKPASCAASSSGGPPLRSS
jgi:hypothetical protein